MSASERIRLKDFRLHTDGARCEAQVSLGWDEEDTYVGTSRGPSSRAGSCSCAAEATITALESAAENRVSLELVGLKTVKAFDSTIVIACLVSRSEHHVLPFLGACLPGTATFLAMPPSLCSTRRTDYWVGLTNSDARRPTKSRPRASLRRSGLFHAVTRPLAICLRRSKRGLPWSGPLLLPET